MTAWQQLFKVTFGVGLQRGLGALLPLALAVIATREQGLEAAGLVGIATAVALVAVALTDLGLTPATARDFPRSAPTRGEFTRLLIIKLVVGGSGAIVLAGVAWVIAPREWALALSVAALSIPSAAATALLTSKLATDGDGVSLSVGAVLGFVAGLTVGFVAGQEFNEPWALLLAIPVGRFAEAAILFAGSEFPQIRTGPPGYSASWVFAAWPLYAYSLILAVNLRGQVVLPRFVLSALESGEVVDGFNLYSAAILLPGALALAAWPRIARATARTPRDGLATALRFTLLAAALMSVPVAGLFIWPGTVTHLLFGESSPHLSAYVRWGAGAALFVGLNGPLLSLVLSLGRTRAVAACCFAVLLLSATMQLTLSARFGVAGAGAAVFLSEGLHTVWLVALVVGSFAPARRRIRMSRVIVLGLTSLFAGVAAVALFPLLVFPGERTGVLLVLPLPLLTFLLIRAARYNLFAPASIFALAWTSALAIAQLPFLEEFNWSGTTWILLTVPPLGVVAGAAFGAGVAPLRRLPPLRTRMSAPMLPFPLAATLVTVGALAWANYFRSIEGVPLFSQDVDVLRFAGFDLPTLIGTRLGYVGLIFAIPGAFLARSRRDFVQYAGCAALGLLPLLLSGGRFYAISACAIGMAATLLLTGLTRRMLLISAAGLSVALLGATVLWFERLDRQPPGEFRSFVFDELVEERPFGLAATLPVQIFGSISMQTLSDLVNTRAYEDQPGKGYYSTKFADRFVSARDLEGVARENARYYQVTSTYVGPWYADFGMTGVILISICWGLLNGVCYRAMAAARSATFLYLYAYASFFLVMAVYGNYWSVQGVWLADVPVIVALTVAMGIRLRFPLRKRYVAGERIGAVAARTLADSGRPQLREGTPTPRIQEPPPPVEAPWLTD